MKRPEPQHHWPESWKDSYRFDLEEVWGEPSNLGYAYAYESRRDRTLKFLADAVPRGSSVLDIAAAQGNFSLALAEMGYRVTWNDLRAELGDYVRQKHEFGEIRYCPGNAFEVEFESLFDAVLITEVIEHVAHPDDFLRRTAQLVRPGGVVVMTTPNGAHFRNVLPRFSDCPDPSAYEAVQFKPDADGHIFLLWPDEIRALAQRAGLVIEAVEYFVNPLTNGHMKTSHLLRVLPKSVVQAIERRSQRLPRRAAEKLLLQVGARFRKPA
jgi:2-polyprenyl-6-hydroxyphenyl methylase/3-demethylubiquinone-9 3-methyltransferase